MGDAFDIRTEAKKSVGRLKRNDGVCRGEMSLEIVEDGENIVSIS